MNLVERSERNRGNVASAATEVKAKEEERAEAVKRLEELQGVLASKVEEVTSEKKRVEELDGKLSSVETALGEETKVVASLREKVEGLQEELRKEKDKAAGLLGTLEKVEKEAVITYKDAVEKYLGSKEFEELLNTKAGYLHEEGFNDCVAFVGAGNVVDPVVHTVQNYRAKVLAEMAEQGKGTDLQG